MGQKLSQRKKSKTSVTSKSPSSSKTTIRSVSKFPFPVESEKLRQIKKDYRTVDQNSSSTCEINNSSGILESKLVQEDFQSIMMKIRQLENIESSKETVSNFQNKVAALLVDKKEDEHNQNTHKPYTITDFPILVIDKLLEYLNPPSILAMRATCSTTKSWIDNNLSILKDFELKIELRPEGYTSASTLHTTQWSNFSIPYSQLQSPFIQETIGNYSDIIWRLKIYPPMSVNNVVSTSPTSSNSSCLFGLINQCCQLEHLNICRIDTLTQIGGELDLYPYLRVLSIDRLQWMHNSDFHVFESLIMKCPLLEYVKIPEYEILGSLAFNFYDVNVSPEKEYLIRPLIRYLDHYRKTKDGDNTNEQRFCSKKLHIDVLEFEDFKLCSSEIFYELSRKCVERNAVLMNVYFVPRDAVLRNQQDIVESFASMFGFIKIDFHAELWKNLEVMECWIEEYPDDPELFERQLSFLKTISKIETLRSLTIRLSIDNCDLCTETLAACVGENYKGIQKLILRRHEPNCENYVEIPIGFGNAFSNVKYLYFQELDSSNKDFRRLWPSLLNLEELFMYKCTYLTQDAFLCEDAKEAPPFLQLTKLKVLVIFLYDGVVGFNDEFLLTTLRYMKLRGFAIRGAAGIEFTDKGMMALLDSPFHDSIEDFEAPSTYFRPSISPYYWNFYILLPKKELRRNRIWLSCSVLLNSLSSRKHSYDFKRKCLEI